jgi:hypothetical protein
MKKEKKTLIIGVTIGLLISLFYAHFFAPRYEIKKEGLSTMKLDKWTGQSWTLVSGNWKKMNSTDENWEEIDKALSEALKIPFAQVDSTSALKKLREKHPVLADVSDDELLERIKLVYSKMVLVNMYLGDFLRTNTDQGTPDVVYKGK